MTGYMYVVIPGAAKGKRIGIVKTDENGYYLTNYDHHDTEEGCKEHVRLINEKRGISQDVEDSALFGSMFGWDCPAAQPCLKHFGKDGEV